MRIVKLLCELHAVPLLPYAHHVEQTVGGRRQKEDPRCNSLATFTCRLDYKEPPLCTLQSALVEKDIPSQTMAQHIKDMDVFDRLLAIVNDEEVGSPWRHSEWFG